MGITFLFNSGDFGVAGYGGACLSANGNICHNIIGFALILPQAHNPLTVKPSVRPSLAPVRM